jgi:hypothetical protein
MDICSRHSPASQFVAVYGNITPYWANSMPSDGHSESNGCFIAQYEYFPRIPGESDEDDTLMVTAILAGIFVSLADLPEELVMTIYRSFSTRLPHIGCVFG